MNTDKIEVTQQEEEEWKLRNQLTGNQSFKAPGKDGEYLGEPKVEPKEGEWWMCGNGMSDDVPMLKVGAEFGFPSSSMILIDSTATPISRLYTQEEYDSKGADDSEWNGEGLPPVGVECEWCGTYGGGWVLCVIIASNDSSMVVQNIGEYQKGEFEIKRPHNTKFRKPETPEQKEARERLEAAYDLYFTFLGVGYTHDISLEEFSVNRSLLASYLAIVDKTGYRK